MRKAALLYEKQDDLRVQCHLCSHHCVIAPGRNGVCRVRQNNDGELYTLVYGRTISQHIDPIEKKPLYHFQPGSRTFSIATPGCNFHCEWCQNWSISQQTDQHTLSAGQQASPEEIAYAAMSSGCRSIAYTYTEPTIFFEYAYDTARIANEMGLKNIFVTNGYMTAGALETIQPCLDAANVDLKAFSETTYKKWIGAKLKPVLESLKLMKQLGIWVEVTTLIIPGINDDPGELKETAEFISQELGVDTPWHISRYHPNYKVVDRPPTDLDTIMQARERGLAAGLRYVYLGNVGGEHETNCYNCGKLLVTRGYFQAASINIKDGKCPDCGVSIAGVWD